MIAWVSTPEGEGALVGFIAVRTAIVLIDKRFRAFSLDDIEWLRWPE